jgi:predicted ATPase/class 3 adenylate cyclase
MAGKGQLDPPAQTPLRAMASDRETATEGSAERRLLTALSYDLVGSTALLAQYDVEDFHDLIVAFQQSAMSAVISRGGYVMELGDGGIGLFLHEMDSRDAAPLAIHAGLEIVEACIRIGREKGRGDMHVRVGIATSIALIRGTQQKLTADNVTAIALAKATRLQAMAEPDTVIVSDRTRSLAGRSHAFRFEGVREVKGIAEPERVWRALSRRSAVGRFYAFGRVNTRLVGRSAELHAIAERWRAAVQGTGGVVLIRGEAGIGKSRLLHEFRRITRSERHRMLLLQCSPGGSRSTLHPLIQSVAGRAGEARSGLSRDAVSAWFARLGIRDADVVDVFSFMLGANDIHGATLRDASPELVSERTSRALRSMLQLVCADGPIALVVEDIHWIDPSSLHLVLELAQNVPRYPALLVLTTRGEGPSALLELPHVSHIPLGRFDPEETRVAIDVMWPRSRRPDAELPDLINRVTGGVPLYIEEICRWMAENTGFTTSQLAKAVTPGAASVLETVLNARIEPLGAAKEVVRAAAVAGMQFDLRLLRELLPDLSPDAILIALDQLGDAGLLVRTRSGNGVFYSFRHALIQETIYSTLLRKSRQLLQRRLFAALDSNRELAPWIGTAALAEHAERAGLIENAIRNFVAAGKESSARSAMIEARHLLEHALQLCEAVADAGARDALKLSAVAALGPVLTSTEGSGSPAARELYESAVEIARRRPVSERAAWFAVYWGWWFTGADVDNKRAQAILDELKDVRDPEIQLQIRHCIWAIDFYLGKHRSCVEAVNAGLPLYEAGRGSENFTLFGGHDAKVCGLSHRALSEWLTGRAASAVRSIAQARQWAHQTEHIGSIAHALYNEAMFNCYRRDFRSLRSVIEETRPLTVTHRLRSLAAALDIFEGWCEGNAGRLERGHDMIRKGLQVHAELQTPEDYPVYCGMLAELLARTGKSAEALELLFSAAQQAERSGHRYWLAEIHRRRARLLFQEGARREDVLSALVQSLNIALEQNAVPLLLAAYETLETLAISRDALARYRNQVESASSRVEGGEPLILDREVDSWRAPVARSVG